MRTAHTLTVQGGVPSQGVCVPARGSTRLGGVPAKGCTCLGGVPAQGKGGVPSPGGTCLQGCTWLGGIPAWGVPAWEGGCTCPGGACLGGCTSARGTCWRGVPARGVPVWGGVPCDLSHHAFDVTCMLPPLQLRHTKCAAAYIVWPRCMLGYTPPPVDRITDTCKNINFPQLRLRAVTKEQFVHRWLIYQTFSSNFFTRGFFTARIEVPSMHHRSHDQGVCIRGWYASKEVVCIQGRGSVSSGVVCI